VTAMIMGKIEIKLMVDAMKAFFMVGLLFFLLLFCF